MATNPTAEIHQITSATNENILFHILRKNTNRNALARSAGLAPTTFNRKIDGHNDFTLRELGSIANALDVKLDKILPVTMITGGTE